MREINTWRDPYDAGFSMTRLKTICIKEGVTILVGCNGIGKTTLLQNIKSELKKDNIPYLYFDNLHDGSTNSLGRSLFYNDIGMAAQKLCSSEGENISLNIGEFCRHWLKFIETGVNKTYNNGSILLEDEINTNERWILMDAIDSGLSVDQVVEVKELLRMVVQDARKKDVSLHIVVSANEYELARDMCCFDVANGKYTKFDNYEDYRKFILRSAEIKAKRYKKEEGDG